MDFSGCHDASDCRPAVSLLSYHRRFRFCHIDVDVCESASQTFDWVWPRLVTGGIVVFDDYGFYSCGGVTRLVDRMIGEPDRLVVYNVNGHALVVKRG
jgi:O-methyltransferase